MRRYLVVWGAVFTLVLAVALPIGALNVLIFDKSGAADFNNPDVPKPGKDDRVQAEYGIKKALADNGYSSTIVTELPKDLKPYDLVFLISGFAFMEAG